MTKSPVESSRPGRRVRSSTSSSKMIMSVLTWLATASTYSASVLVWVTFSASIVTSRHASRSYGGYQFHSEPFKQRVITVAVGQTMASLNTQILNNVLVAIPPRSEQTAIATVLSDMDAEISTLEAKLAKARMLKQGMMQELLTGRTRLV